VLGVLRAFLACTLYISAGQRLLRWIYGQCYEDPNRATVDVAAAWRAVEQAAPATGCVTRPRLSES
jgi:hypothetical protein